MGLKVTQKKINAGFNQLARFTARTERAIRASQSKTTPHMNKSYVTEPSSSHKMKDDEVAGWISFFICAIIGVILFATNDSVLVGFLLIMLCLFLGIIVAFIVTFIVGMLSERVVERSTTLSFNNYQGASEAINKIKYGILQNISFEQLEMYTEEFPNEIKKKVFTNALDYALSELCSDITKCNQGIEEYIDSYIKKFDLEGYTDTTNGVYLDYVAYLTINDLLHGVIPHRCTIDNLPINFQLNENLLMVFQNVTYYKETITTSYSGTSSGISIKIAKGVYYRTGAFNSAPIVNSNITPQRKGMLIMTDKSIYFYSLEQSMKYPLDKILAFTPFNDGLGIQLNRSGAKTEIFSGLNGRTAYNIFINIKNIL